jgi:hypothetical protein
MLIVRPIASVPTLKHVCASPSAATGEQLHHHHHHYIRESHHTVRILCTHPLYFVFLTFCIAGRCRYHFRFLIPPFRFQFFSAHVPNILRRLKQFMHVPLAFLRLHMHTRSWDGWYNSTVLALSWFHSELVQKVSSAVLFDQV